MSADTTRHPPNATLLFTMLPGSNRKQHPSIYRYRLKYTNPDSSQPGCAMLWEVAGGRMTYQIALERAESGELRWHCTCATQSIAARTHRTSANTSAVCATWALRRRGVNANIH